MLLRLISLRFIITVMHVSRPTLLVVVGVFLLCFSCVSMNLFALAYPQGGFMEGGFKPTFLFLFFSNYVYVQLYCSISVAPHQFLKITLKIVHKFYISLPLRQTS